MTTFYRPISGNNSGLRELWARCDICHQSGPFAGFHEWALTKKVITVCLDCDSQAWLSTHLSKVGGRKL